jgi:hypothetical protein
MPGSRPQQDANPLYAVVLLRKRSDRRYDRRAARSVMNSRRFISLPELATDVA